jgi:hypothetical protein
MTEEKQAFLQSSLRDSIFFCVSAPSTEVLGYCHLVPDGTLLKLPLGAAPLKFQRIVPFLLLRFTLLKIYALN